MTGTAYSSRLVSEAQRIRLAHLFDLVLDVEDLVVRRRTKEAEEQVLDQAMAARTSVELKAEIATLQRLEALTLTVRRSGADRKWRELASLLSEIFAPAAIANRVAEEPSYGAGAIPCSVRSPRQTLVFFTARRDTLSYLEAAFRSPPPPGLTNRKTGPH